MTKNKLREIEGEKIRWQYFSGPIIIWVAILIFVPYSIFVFDTFEGTFDFTEWISGVWVAIKICGTGSLPFIILSILNRHLFGKIVCVLSEDGIHYKDGFNSWDEIEKIEYEIEIPGKHRASYDFCRAVVHTDKRKIEIVHAPLFLLSRVKKYSPDIIAAVSKRSKIVVLLFVAAIVVITPLIPFME